MRRTLTLAALLVLAACAAELDGLDIAEEADTLVGGRQVEPGEWEPVVALLARGTGAGYCTGTLVSPSVVLTAAHCVNDGVNSTTVYFGNERDNDAREVSTWKHVKHPDWDGDVTNANDLGMVILRASQETNLPMPIEPGDPTAFLDETLNRVGFGRHLRDVESTDGKKRHFATVLDEVTADSIITTGTDEASVCNGDSGGPSIVTVDGEKRLLGVVSWGQDRVGLDCIGNNGDSRVDIHLADFIQPYIDENDPVCGKDFTCATIGCSADPDCEPCGTDGTCVSNCELPDPDCPTQALGEICWADSQCETGICVYWQPDPQTMFCTEACDDPSDCPTGMSCAVRPDVGKVCYFERDPDGVLGDPCDDAAECGSQICDRGHCVRPCDYTVGLVCPDDFECKTHNDEDYYCYAIETDGGGCAVAAPNRGRGSLPPTIWLGPALLVILLAGRRRRRSRPV